MVDLYRFVRKPVQGRRPVESADALRAAVVFLHATVEELVRALLVWKAPEASRQNLDGIEITPIGWEKFKLKDKGLVLGWLSEHRTRTVPEVIALSVEEYAKRMSVNSSSDLARYLQGMGLDPNCVQEHFAQFDSLTDRRHKIVHRADRNETPGRGQHAALSLGEATVVRWIATVRALAEALLKAV
jgi:hypothetical protein